MATTCFVMLELFQLKLFMDLKKLSDKIPLLASLVSPFESVQKLDYELKNTKIPLFASLTSPFTKGRKTPNCLNFPFEKGG